MKAFDLSLFKKILQYAKPYQNRLRWVVFWSLLLALVSVVRPLLLKETIDSALEQKNEAALFWLISFMGSFLVLEVLSQYFFVYWANWLGQDIVKDLRKLLFAKINRFKVAFFDKASVGQLVTRTVSDIEAIARIFSQGLFMIISDLLKMLAVLVVMFYMNWKLSWIVVLFMPLIVYATRIFQIKMKGAFEEVRTNVANLNVFVQERLSGMKVVQMFHREEQELENFKKINHQHRKSWVKTVWYNSIFFPIADGISNFTLGGIVLFGGLMILKGDPVSSPGDLFAYTMFIGMLYNPLRQIADKFNELQMGMIAAKRVFELMEESEPIQNQGSLKTPLTGQVTFEHVWFAYKEPEFVIKDLNLQIKPGEKIAIVGATGAGKSTIIHLINRFYEVQKGKILLDNQPIENYDLTSLRKQVGMVLQDVFLFSDTILNNITLGNNNISLQDVIEAAKKIGIHDFIQELPEQYQFHVRERGAMLSLGQRQLISFLRVYVAQPKILILDEATSSIDTHTEELIQRATEVLTENRTSIIIAHRLATIMHADRILVMEKGSIVEEGTHDSLLQIENGFYKNLYESQFLKEMEL
jgi:ABC-type multidrug transport system fused ATPase/permease subunit